MTPDENPTYVSFRSDDFVDADLVACDDFRLAGWRKVTALGITCRVRECACGAVWADHLEAWC